MTHPNLVVRLHDRTWEIRGGPAVRLWNALSDYERTVLTRTLDQQSRLVLFRRFNRWQTRKVWKPELKRLVEEIDAHAAMLTRLDLEKLGGEHV